MLNKPLLKHARCQPHAPPQQLTASSGVRLWGCRAVRALARSGKRPTDGKEDFNSRVEATDEELIYELNTAHLWLPNEQQSADFGLDDVEVHLASRHQAQVRDFSQSRSIGGSKRGSRSSGQSVSTLSDVNPESDELPSWVQELKEQGFDVLGREGELFLQRGSVQEQQPNSSGRSLAVDNEPAAAPLSRSQQLAQQKLEEAAAAIPDSNLAVRLEFNPSVWQQSAVKHDGVPAISSTPPDAWYAGNDSSSSDDSNKPPSVGQANTSARAVRQVKADVHKRLLGFNHPDRLLSYIEICFPVWSSNGCWLLHQRRLGAVLAPTPGEAASALKGVALAAKRAGYNTVQTQGLARDRRVLGLVECLRLTPPRSPPQQPTSISKRLWSIAKAYWLQAGSAAAAARQELLTCVAAAAAKTAASANGVQQSSVLNGGAGDSVPSLGPLLAQLQSSGVSLSRQQLAAAQALIRSRQQEQQRQQAFVSAVWAMSAIGGPLFFQQEMDALVQVAALVRWHLSAGEVSDVLWALANSHHWSKLLPQLDNCLAAAGGLTCCTAPELVSMLWSYATLAHRPVQLLQQLNKLGWAVRPVTDLPAAQRSSSTAAATSKRKHKQQEQGKQHASACRLHELSDSQLTSVLWSLACLQEVNSDVFKAVWVETCQRGMSLSSDVRQLVRVQQAVLAIQLEGDFELMDLYWDQGAAQLLAAACKVFKAQSGVLQNKVHSTYQRAIALILSQQRVMHVVEDNTTGYSVDISIPSLRVAIEADGPSHMSRNTVGKRGRVQLGATAMKRRHLQGLGWGVVNISYDEWDALPGEGERTTFLKQLIKAARAELLAAIQS